MATTTTTVAPSLLVWTGSDDYVAEASELRWPPGYFPEVVHIGPDFGNGQPLLLTTLDDGRAVYTQEFGITRVVVFND